MAILIKGNPKEGEYKLIKTTDGWILEGKDIAYCGTELEKANKTIEELMKINEELGAYNGQFDAARKRIQELEDDVRYYKNRLSEMIEESQAEKNLIKSAVKEAIKEMINGEIK